MNLVSRVSSFLSRYIGIVIIIFSIFAFIYPSGFEWATNYTAWFLGIAMFGMGLTIKWDDFKNIFSHKRDVLLGCIAQYTIMPLSAWALAVLFNLGPDLAIGVILVGCCPGGTASNVITYIARGDVALSVGMTTVSTLIAPLMTPLLVVVLGGAWIQVPFFAMILSVVKIILIPVMLGIVLNKIFNQHIEKIKGVLPLISVIAIVMIIAGIVAKNTTKIISCGILVLVVVVIHNLCGLIVGFIIAKMAKLEYSKATAVAIEVAMQNSGLAVSLAMINFATNPLATLPGAIFSVWHNISGSILASIRRKGSNI